MAHFVKADVSAHEAYMQRRAAKLLPDHVPRVIAYYTKTHRMKMQRIVGDTIATIFGEAPGDTPPKIWDEIRRLVRTLYEGGIVHADITSFNFMIDAATETVWIIDFEHCTTRPPGPFADGDAPAKDEHWFVREFLSGDSGNVWNEDFA